MMVSIGAPSSSNILLIPALIPFFAGSFNVRVAVFEIIDFSYQKIDDDVTPY